MKQNRVKLIGSIAIFLIILLNLANTSANASSQDELKAHFIDVGQGDAILLQYGSSNILLDTGTEGEYKNLSDYLKKIDVKSIESLIISHPDADHMGGADLVIKDYSVKKIYMTKYETKTNEYKEMLAAIKKYKVKRVNVKEGSTIPIGKLKAAVLAADDKASDTNSSSIVLKLIHDKKSFLLTGDAPAKVENKVRENYDIDVDVLKVAHHGSDYSSPIAYLKEASPEYSIISVGKDNRYGHPVKTVVNRLNQYSEHVYRTDQNGTIVITSTGTSLECTIAKNVYNAENSNSNNAVTTKNKIGNVNTKKYHNPNCRSLPDEKNRIYFKSNNDAEKNGYTACKNCH